MVNNYSGIKAKMMSCCHIMMTTIVIFSLFVGLSLVGTVSVAAGSTMSAPQIGGDGQEFQEEEGQQQQNEIQLCGSNNNNSTNGAGVTDGTNTNTTAAGIVGTDNNNSTTTGSIYENRQYGIQMLCPEDWVSMETENPLTFDFQVTFASLMDMFETGRTPETGETPEMPPTVGVAVMELPFGNADVRLLEDIITRGIASGGQQIISTNPNATLSGMPALEVVTVEPENSTRGMQLWTIQGDKAYGVLYLSHESTFDQSLPIAQDMISSFAITDGTSTTAAALTGNNNNTNTTISGIVGTDNNNNNLTTRSVYENPQHGIEIRHPEDWIYMEGAETAFPLDFFNIVFVSPMDAFEVGRTLESGGTPEVPPAVAVMISELPIGTADVRQFGNYLTEFLTSEGQQIISTNPNATLSGMPALEVVTVEPENSTRNFYVSTVQGNIAYSIGYTSHESTFDQSLPIAQDMISSFAITDGTSTTAAPNTSTTNQFQTPSESPTTTTTDGGLIDTNNIINTNNNQATSLEAARQQYLTVWNQTEFQIVFNTFIEPGSGTAYGVYEEHDTNNIFRPGENIVLNLEPVGFGHQRLTDDAGNSLYLMNLAADIIVSDANGNELASLEDLPLIDFVSHRQNTEMHLAATVTQNQPLPVGDYIITYIIHDNVKGESFQIDKRITIASDDSSITTTSTATGLNASADTTQSQISSEPSATTITSSATEEDNQSIDLEAARQQYLQVWNQTEFQIVFNTFIEPGSATGHGIYEERDNNNIFRLGETIQLYAEPAAFGHQRLTDDNNGNTVYTLNFTADMILSDTNGNELTSIENFPLTDIVSHRQNTEIHLDLSLTQESPFPVGDYIITYIIHDNVKGESFQIDKRITIAADEADDGGAETSAATVQEGQQQPQEVDWLLYENATYGVRMLYPSDWFQTGGSTVGEDNRFVVVSNFYSPEETDWAYVFTAIDNMPTNLESSLNDTIDSYSQEPSFRDFQVLSTSMNNFTLAGMPAYTLEATYIDAELGPQQLLAVETIIDNKGYAIQYIASPQTYQQYFPIAERMIESFEITQQLQQQEQDEDEGEQQQLQQ